MAKPNTKDLETAINNFYGLNNCGNDANKDSKRLRFFRSWPSASSMDPSRLKVAKIFGSASSSLPAADLSGIRCDNGIRDGLSAVGALHRHTRTIQQALLLVKRIIKNSSL